LYKSFCNTPYHTLLGLTLFAGFASGLTVGFLSIDKLELEIKGAIGTNYEKRAVSDLIFCLEECHIGSNNLTYLKAASFLIGHSLAIQCFCNGSSPNLPRCNRSIILGSYYISYRCPFLW